MKHARVPRLAVLLIASGCARAAMAQDDFEIGAAPIPPPPQPLFRNSIELGLGYQSEESFRLGRYGGVIGAGPFAIAAGHLVGGSDWTADSRAKDGAEFWKIDFGLRDWRTRSLSADTGVQGHWRAQIAYDAFTRAYTETARSPFNGIGTPILTLPGGWISGASSSQFTTLARDLKPFDAKVAWQSAGGAFTLNPFDGYEAQLHFDYRNRHGLRIQSLPFGQESNFPVGVFFPQPVDYDSYNFRGSFGFTGQRLQWTASYSFAAFSDNVAGTFVPNPYSRSLGTPWPAGAFSGYPFAFGQYSSPPDSTAHTLALAGALNLTAKTRLTLNASYAVQLQNAPFLPYTANAQLNVATPLPRTSLDGKAVKTHIAVRLTSREWEHLDLAAGYTMDERDNRTPMDLYSYVANDVQDQQQPAVPGASRYIRYNLPYSYTFHQVKGEAGYRLTPHTRLSVTYTGDFKSRTYQEVADTQEHTVTTKAQTTFPVGSAWLSYTYANRGISNYRDDYPWNISHTPAYLNTSIFNQSIEHPLLRKYNLADRVRNEVKTGATFTPTNALSVNVSGGYAKDDYANSPLGLHAADSLSGDVDLSYVFSKTLTSSVFYSLQTYGARQNGYLILDLNDFDPARNWKTHSRDTSHTAGLRVDWQALPDKLKLSTSYTLSLDTSRIETQAAPPLFVSAPLPDARDVTHTASVSGEYTLRADTALRLGYTIERHITTDWQYDNMGFAPVAQILGPGIIPPRYTAHIVWATVRYAF